MKKKLFRPYGHTIVGKVTMRLLLIELLMLILLVFLSQTILLPRIRQNSVGSAVDEMNYLAAQVESQINHYANYSQFIIQSNAIREHLSNYRSNPSQQNYHLLSLALTEQLSCSSTLRGLQLEGEDGLLVRSAINLREADFAQLNAEWYEEILHNNSTRFFSQIYDPGLSTPGYSLAYARTYYIGTERYVLTLFLNCSDLISIVRAATSSFNGILITDYLNTPFYETGELANSYSMSNAVSTNGSQYKPQSEGYYFYSTISVCNWTLVGFVNSASLKAGYSNIFSTSVALCLALSLLTILTAIPTMSHTIRPIRTLSKTMQQVATGDHSVVAPVQSNDEIGDLSRIFNQMLHSLNDSMERQISFETNEQKMRYNLLLAQIDSHFIGNTMSTVNSLARQGRTADVVALNTALLKIIQNNLRIRDLDITDTIAQEMEIVEQYWLISKIRQENHATLTWDIPDELLEHCIPKNIIQPLVENSLFHGLTDENTGEIRGEIAISAEEGPESIRLVVRDNGKGIPKMMLDYLNRSENTIEYLRERGRHIGIANVRQRLEYFYSRDCLSISCNNGTTVSITIPKN